MLEDKQGRRWLLKIYNKAYYINIQFYNAWSELQLVELLVGWDRPVNTSVAIKLKTVILLNLYFKLSPGPPADSVSHRWLQTILWAKGMQSTVFAGLSPIELY